MIYRPVFVALLMALLTVSTVHAAPPAPTATPRLGYEVGDILYVHVTYYYPTGNATASGVYPYFGSAGCSKATFPTFGVTLQFENGMTVKCIDRGNDADMDPHVDIFCPGVSAGCDEFPGVGNWHVLVPVKVIGP